MLQLHFLSKTKKKATFEIVKRNIKLKFAFDWEQLI